MTDYTVTIGLQSQAVPCALKVAVPSGYDAQETLMLAATQASTTLPWGAASEVLDADGTIDPAACLHTLLMSALHESREASVTVDPAVRKRVATEWSIEIMASGMRKDPHNGDWTLAETHGDAHSWDVELRLLLASTGEIAILFEREDLTHDQAMEMQTLLERIFPDADSTVLP